MNEPRMRSVLLVVAAYHLILGGFMFLAPGPFYDALGKFPPENHHFIKDVATFYIAFGAAFYVSVRRPSWRVPLLAFAVLEYALHALNHLIDVNDAVSTGKGWFAVFALGLLTLAFAFLLGAASRGVREPKAAAVEHKREPDREPGPDRETHPGPEPGPGPSPEHE